MAVPSKGRPRLPGSVRQIRLRSSVFDLWNQKKSELGFAGVTNSVFAEVLLHRPMQNTEPPRRILEPDEIGMASSTDPSFLVSSTPVRPVKRRRVEIDTGSPFSYHGKSLDVDVTGTSSHYSPSTSKQDRCPEQTLCINSIDGNPFSSFTIDPEKPSEESDDSSDDDDDVDDFEDKFKFGDRLDSIIEDLCDDREEAEISDSNEEYSTSENELDAFDMDVGFKDDEVTLTMVEDLYLSTGEVNSSEHLVHPAQWSILAEPQSTEIPAEDEPSHCLDHIPAPGASQLQELPSEDHEPALATSQLPEQLSNDQEPAPVAPEVNTVAGNCQDVLKALEQAFAELTSTSNLQDILSLHSRMRVVVSIEKLMELKGAYCASASSGLVCGAAMHYSTKHIGTRVDLEWKCGNGHYGKWESSEVLTTNRNSKVYLNDSLLPIAIVLSGNNFAKFELLCKVLNLSLISKSNFCNFQTKCALPVVKDVWSKMRSLVMEILRAYKEICLCGDGRNDSPGHSARYCVYTLMEHVTKVVVDIEVIDKRETGGNSTVMEREGLRRLLERLMSELPLDELCTDASATIIKLVRDMKDRFPLLVEMFHSLDVWHKAKKITKALHQAARMKGCEELKEWIDPVVNHFWYCCQMAEGSVEGLKNMWQGVLHHVCNEHVWAESSCNHGPHVEKETSRKPLSKSSKAMAALRKIVLDPKWLKNLHFYVRFRHTGELEKFNSMMTKYAPKRMAFEYPYFIMRILLAAIDHNFHLFRKPKQSPGGELIGHRKYSKRTQRYHAEIIKEEKAYAYFPYMVTRMLDARRGFEGNFSCKLDVDEFNPKQIAPTLAMKAPPTTEELMKAPSRFAMKPKHLKMNM